MIEQSQQTTQNYYEKFREQIFLRIGNYMEKGYKFIKIKQPRTSDEEAYLKSYENMFLLQSTGLFFLSLSGFYFVKLTLKGKKANDNVLKPLVIKAGILAGFGSLFSFNAFMINMREKTLQKTELYGKQFQALAKSITPQNLF